MVLKDEKPKEDHSEKKTEDSKPKEKTFIITSNDDKSFKVSESAAFLCNVVKDMVKNLEDVPDGQVIPVPNADGKVLEKVVEWLNHHKNDQHINEVSKADHDSNNIPDWDKEFLDISQKSLFELIIAANYLDIKGLLDFSCKTVANQIKGRDTEQLRQLFGIKPDFTPEEEAEIRQQNAWVEDNNT